MSTTFAAFVSTGVTLAYSCVRLRNVCPHQQVYQTVWMFEGNHWRLRKDFGQFGIFFDGCPMLTNGVEALSQTGIACEDTRGSFTFLFFVALKHTASGDAMSFAKTVLDNTLFIAPSVQMMFKLT
jgi:hypothetical protein